MFNKPVIAVWAALAAFLVSHVAWGYDDAQIHDRVQSRLMDRHPSDTPDWWKSLGENAATVVIAMYNSETNTFHRIRLLQGLGWMDNPQATDFVKQQAQQTDLDTVRNAAIRAIGRGAGAKEIDFLSKYLKDEDPQTRLAAAESLKGIHDPRAQGIYDSYLKEEKTPWLRDRLNGKLDVPGALKPVASSEDRLSPDFEGTWRGYWVEPKRGGVKGMESAPVVLQLKPGTGDLLAVGGELLVMNHGNAAKTFSLSGTSGKGVQLAGSFVEAGAKSPKNAKPLMQISFQGGLTRMGATMLLELRVPERASVLVLKKD